MRRIHKHKIRFNREAQRLAVAPPSIDAPETASLLAMAAPGIYSDAEIVEFFKPAMMRSIIIGNRVQVIKFTITKIPYEARRRILAMAVLYEKMDIIRLLTSPWTDEAPLSSNVIEGQIDREIPLVKPKWWPCIVREEHLASAVLIQSMEILKFLLPLRKSNPWTYFLSCWDNPLRCSMNGYDCLIRAIDENNIAAAVEIQRQTHRFNIMHLCRVCRHDRVELLRTLKRLNLIKLHRNDYDLVRQMNPHIAALY